MNGTGSRAPADPLRDSPVPPSLRRRRLAASGAALLAAGALLILPPTASAAAARMAPVRSAAQASAAAGADTFMAVSCPTTSMCMAVGKVALGATQTILAEQWNGQRWLVT